MCPTYSSSYSTITLTLVVFSFFSRFFSVFSILANHPYYCTGYYVDRSDYTTSDEDFAVLCDELFHFGSPSLLIVSMLVLLQIYRALQVQISAWGYGKDAAGLDRAGAAVLAGEVWLV